MSIVYLTWDGPGCEYLQSLFFPVLQRLGEPVGVLELSYGTREEAERTRAAAAARGVDYLRVSIPPIPYSGVRSAVGIAAGIPLLPRYLRSRQADVLMIRNVMSGLIALSTRRLHRDLAMVFDSDGFLPDERVDFVGWSSSGWAYRLLRDVESQLVRVSDAVLARTEQGSEILRARGGAGLDDETFWAIPNGKDPEEFRPGSSDERQSVRAELGFTPQDLVLVYCGSLGPQYLPEQLLELSAQVYRAHPETRLLILTASLDRAREMLAARTDLPPGMAVAQRVPPSEVARYLRAADVGLALRRPSFSQRGVSPIKVAEYLLTGIPIVCNDGVSDVTGRLADNCSVLLLPDVTPSALQRAAAWVPAAAADPERKIAARRIGQELFSLETAATSYRHAIETARARRSRRVGAMGTENANAMGFRQAP